MKVHLLYADQDLDLKRALPPNADDLVQDLELNLLLDAMAGGDEFLREVAAVVILSSLNDSTAITYRQAALRDCLDHSDAVVKIYNLAVDTIQAERGHLRGFWKSPESILHRSVEVLELFVEQLKQLRRIADEHAAVFTSEAFTTLFSMLATELNDDYFATIDDHLKRLQFHDGVLNSARMGKGLKGTHYVLRKPNPSSQTWAQRLTGRGRPESYGFQIAERDEAGYRALSDLQGRGTNLVANALAQSTDHILSFFVMLRTELAFYIGCLKLSHYLRDKGEPICLPEPLGHDGRGLAFRGLYDVSLALSVDERVVGNDIDARQRPLIVITGANRGGKSTFLRSLGLAQLMMQCGMFVGAESYRSHTVTRLFTHFKREEDSDMRKGKFEEELARMSDIADHLVRDSLVLFNESFASTNEREGAHIATEVFTALLDAGVGVIVVTHLFELAGRLMRDNVDDALFLRAERLPDGQRTFRLTEAPPLPTSYGEDLYERIFGAARESADAS
jgi:DNA mismatch repair ATPase MutS